MDSRELIREYRALMKQAERLALELDAIRDARPKSPIIDGMPKTGNNSSLDLQMEIIEAAEKRFQKARERALERLEILENMIDNLPEFELQAVLYFRYIYKMQWSEVSERMNMSESTCRRWHNKALAEMERKNEHTD